MEVVDDGGGVPDTPDDFDPAVTCEYGYYKNLDNECVLCDAAHCDDWPPPCGDGNYRPTEGEKNEYGLVDCAVCDNTDCDDFVVPECDPGDYRPLNGDNNA